MNYCRSVHPEAGVGCTLSLGHTGPHNNVRKDRELSWENLGNGPCWMESPGGEYGCLKDKGHSGPHQNGETTWTENIPDPLA